MSPATVRVFDGMFVPIPTLPCSVAIPPEEVITRWCTVTGLVALAIFILPLEYPITPFHEAFDPNAIAGSGPVIHISSPTSTSPLADISLVYTLFHRLECEPKLYITFASGIREELISAPNETLSVSEFPNVKLPLMVALHSTVRFPIRLRLLLSIFPL